MKPIIPEADPRLDRALDTYPLAPLPAGFVRRTVQRLPAHGPRFRLDFLDVVLPVFLSVFIFSLGFAGLWLGRLLPPHWLQNLQVEMAWLISYTAPRYGVYLPWIGLAVAGLLGLALLAATTLLLPARRIRTLR